MQFEKYFKGSHTALNTLPSSNMHYLKLNIIILISFLSILSGCNGQTKTDISDIWEQNKYQTFGDTVKELGNNIMIIYQDKKNNYWFGSWQDGLYKYDGNSIIQFTTKHGLPNNRIEDIKEDKYGNLFVNTTKGLSKYNGSYFLTLTEKISIENNWKLNPDDLWFKNSGKVYRYDGENLYNLQLPTTKLGEDYIKKHQYYTKPYDIYCLYKDVKGNIWFGTAQIGVCRYNGESFDWISETDVTELHGGPANGVRSIAEDKDGNFWFNTEYRYRIYKNDVSTKDSSINENIYKRIKSIGSLDGKKEGDLNEYLSIIKDNDNNVWIATYRNGVWKYDGTNITFYPVQINGKDITLYCLYKDNDGNLWLGTDNNGAFKFNGKTFDKFK